MPKHQRRIAGLDADAWAASLEEAEAALDAFAQKWDDLYPAISQIWIRHWENVIPLFDYPMAIRKVIYRTHLGSSLKGYTGCQCHTPAV